MLSFSPAGASSASALATFRLIESFLKLPTITATLRTLSMLFFFYGQSALGANAF